LKNITLPKRSKSTPFTRQTPSRRIGQGGKDFNIQTPNYRRNTTSNSSTQVSGVKGMLFSIIRFPKRLWVSGFFKTKKFQFLILPFIIVVGAGAYGYYWFFYISSSYFTATIRYKYIPITENRTITAASNSTDFKTIKLEAEDDASGYVSTTQEKTTGERAKGNLSLFNTTPDIRVIPKGTVLTCTTNICNTLTYTTNSDINLGPGGSEKVGVTAGDIGLNYNISTLNQRFKVGNFNSSDIFASNVEKIEGGTAKKVIKIVDKKDIELAEEAAMKEMKERILNKIKIDPGNSNYIISDASLKVEKISSSSDFKEGEESEIVNVNVRAKGVVDAFSNDEISKVVEQMKTDLTPAGYYLDEKQTNFSKKVVAQTPDKIDIQVTLNTIARPTIDTDKIIAELKGKKYSQADKVLSQIPNIMSYTKSYSPETLPQFFWNIPSTASRIKIDFIAEKQ
jgi:hypothetical protein